MEEVPQNWFGRWKLLWQEKVGVRLQSWRLLFVSKFSFLPHIFNWKILSLVLIVGALPVGVYLAEHEAIFNQHAAETTAPPVVAKNVPILALEYYPPDKNNPSILDKNETGLLDWQDNNIANYKAKVAKLIPEAMQFLDDGSRYHGYKDSLAQPYLHYTLAAAPVVFDAPVPSLFPPGNAAGTPSIPKYALILAQQNICNWVNNYGVKEVWIFMYQSSTISPEESRMVSQFGNVANSYSENDLKIPTLLQAPHCSHSYTIYDYNYTRDLPEMIHDHMHQLENLIWYAAGDEPYPDGSVPGQQRGMFWGDFATYGRATNGCGWAHFPPNQRNDSSDSDQQIMKFIRNHPYGYLSYNYSSKTSVFSNCEDWNPDHAQSTFKQISCDNWGCTEAGYYKWWQQNMPGYANSIMVNGKGMRNWWDLVADFDGFIAQGRTLWCKSGYCSGYIPPTVQRPIPNNAQCSSATDGKGTCVAQSLCNAQNELQAFPGGNFCGVSSGTICCIPRVLPTPTPTPTPAPRVDNCSTGYCVPRGQCVAANSLKLGSGTCAIAGNVCCIGTDTTTDTTQQTTTKQSTTTTNVNANVPANANSYQECETGVSNGCNPNGSKTGHLMQVTPTNGTYACKDLSAPPSCVQQICTTTINSYSEYENGSRNGCNPDGSETGKTLVVSYCSSNNKYYCCDPSLTSCASGGGSGTSKSN